MSQENVDALKAAYEAFASGDLDAAAAILDPEIVVTDHDRVLDTPRQYRGPQGVVQMAMEAAESFAEHRYEPEGFREAGDRVIVSVRRRGRGKVSGIDVDEPQWHVWDFREGKAVRLRTFVSRPDALEAAGLSD